MDRTGSEKRSALSEELMREVKRRVEERKRQGLYEGTDDSLPFAELALEDDLAAAANRVAAAARIPSVVPELQAPPPHEGRALDSDEAHKTQTEPATLAGDRSHPPSAALVRTAALVGRRAFRLLVGDRVDRFVDGAVDFFFSTASFARVAAERIVALESRVAELEAVLETRGGKVGGKSEARTRKAAPSDSFEEDLASDSSRSEPQTSPGSGAGEAPKGASGESSRSSGSGKKSSAARSSRGRTTDKPRSK